MEGLFTYFLLASVIGLIHGHSYPITGPNSIVHPDCSGSSLSVSRTLGHVVRGDSNSPCTGYLKLSSSSLCQEAGISAGLPVKAMAQRACYSLGHSVWRGSNFRSGSTDQIMLYDCDIYTEDGVDVVQKGGTGATWEGSGDGGGNPITGTHCLYGDHSHCFDDCYNPVDPLEINGFSFSSVCSFGTQYWAVTCADIDECHVGVHAHCEGPFLESCTPRKACGKHAHCSNTQGGWTCACEDGYSSEDPYVNECYDIDECQDDQICGYHAQCINKPGSYICVCLRPELYNVETKACEKSTCPVLSQMPYATSATSLPLDPEYGDEVTFNCAHGYKVMDYSPAYYGHHYYNYYYYSSNSQSYYNYYHTAATSFKLKCDASGSWTPYPIPVCKPIECRDPGYILHTVRTGNSFRYNDKVTYTCESGYRPRLLGDSTSFTIQCQENGDWTKGTTCEDVNECITQPGICKGYAKHCINTPGSYLCSCSPWYSEESDENCYNYEPRTKLPTPCEQMKTLGICNHGQCQMKNDLATCICDEGYEGTTCDLPVTNQAIIIAITALVVGVICLVLITCFLWQRYHRRVPPPPMNPIYAHGPAPRWNPKPRRPVF